MPRLMVIKKLLKPNELLEAVFQKSPLALGMARECISAPLPF